MIKNRTLSKPKVVKVPLGEIKTDPGTFQPRAGGLNHGHIAELVKAIGNGSPLDPIRARVDEKGLHTVHRLFES